MYQVKNEELKGLGAVKYALDVANGKIISGKYIILECIRFINDLNRMDNEDFEWTFDVKIYKLVTEFPKMFKFSDGVLANKPMKLAKFQEWILGNIFCWVHKKEGYVRFSKAYIQVSRKQGKSFICGLIMLIKSLLEDYGQLTCVATKKDQAEIVIKEVKKLLDKAIPSVKEKFDIYGKAKISKIMCNITQSEIYPLSSDYNTLDGLGLSVAIVDEWGAHADYSLYEVCRSSQTYKLDSQIIAITTAYPNINTSPAYKERCQLIDSYEGVTEMDDRYFSAIYELDENDDYMIKENWVKSNPLFADFPSIMKKLESDFENALKDPQKLQLFLTKNLNIWLTQDSFTSYVDFDEWKKCEGKVSFYGREVVIGIDMSKTTDLCGVSILSKDENDNILVHSKAFLPNDIVPQKEITDKLPYSSYLMENNKYRDILTATEGKFVNQIEVEKYIRSIEEKYFCKISKICFDSWGALGLMSSLSADYDVIDVKMNYRDFSPTIKDFREKVYSKKIIYDSSPILDFCVANAITKSDLQENILLDKRKSKNRIDLLVSTIIGYSEIFNEEFEEDYGYFTV